MKNFGKVYLVGSGPGDLELITLRGWNLIKKADVIVYDYLCNPSLLNFCKASTKIIYVGKKASDHTLTQKGINELLIEVAQKYSCVVRLKGGDPYIFGRGAEEAEELDQAGIEFEIVPGISSAVAAPAYAGIPLTHREDTSMFTVVTGHESPEKKESSVDWKQIAKLPGTKVVLMGVRNLKEIISFFCHHSSSKDTPAALVSWGTLGKQKTIEGTLSTIVEIAHRENFQAPAVLIVGDVVKRRKSLNWFEKRPLWGVSIVITRSRSHAGKISGQLQNLGAQTLEIPMIKIQPKEKWKGAPKNWHETLSKNFDWIIFTSPSGVDIFFEQLMKKYRDIRALGKIRFASVGSVTSQKIKAMNLEVEKQPKSFTLTSLKKTFSPNELRGKRLLLPRGNLASKDILSSLSDMGAQVTEWEIYETLKESEDIGGAREEYRKNGADWIIFTSSSAVKNWDDLGLKVSSKSKKPKNLSIGPMTSLTLSSLQYPIDVEAKEHNIQGVISSLLKIY